MSIKSLESGNDSEATKFLEHVVDAMRSVLDEPFSIKNLEEYNYFIFLSAALCKGFIENESEYPKAKALLLDMLKTLDPPERISEYNLIKNSIIKTKCLIASVKHGVIIFAGQRISTIKCVRENQAGGQLSLLIICSPEFVHKMIYGVRMG